MNSAQIASAVSNFLAFFFACLILTCTNAYASIAFVAPDKLRERSLFESLKQEIAQLQPQKKTLEFSFVAIDYNAQTPLVTQLKTTLTVRPELIIAVSSSAALAVKEAFPDVPLIFATQQDPVAVGIVDQLGIRKTRATGFTSFLPIHRKQLQLLHSFDSKIKTIGIIGDQGWRDTPGIYEDIAQTASRLKIKPVVFIVNRTDDLAKALSTAGKVDAWFVPATPAVADRIDETIKLINQRAKPAIFGLTEFAKRGGLMAYQAKLDPPTKIWAQMIVSILAGTPIESIPVDRPRHFELSLNTKTLREQSLAVPSLIRDQVTKTFN